MVLFTIGHAQADNSIRERAMAQRKYSVMSVEDYLVLNRNSKDTRYEYLDGEIRMLAGGSPDRSIIIANLTAAIKGPLKGSQYRVYNSDVQLKLSESKTLMREQVLLTNHRIAPCLFTHSMVY
jgi:Putative restriction endonuclease